MLLVCPPTLTGCFRLEMRTAGKRFSLYQGPVDLFRLEIGKEKVFSKLESVNDFALNTVKYHVLKTNKEIIRSCRDSKESMFLFFFYYKETTTRKHF